MQPILNIAITAATQAGKIINQYVDRVDSVRVMEKSRNDFVSEVDRLAEQVIIENISKAYPDHGILAEESGVQGSGDYQWIIDPLDGTANFLRGFPQFAVSIAVKHKHKIVAGVVYDPTLHELYTAISGKGARLNNRRIRVSKTLELSKSLIGTGFPFKHPEAIAPYMPIFKDIMSQSSGIRRAGAAALDLAYVAAGRLDGFWEDGLSAWDMAAGALLIEEAGGIVTDYDNQKQYLSSGNLVCGNNKTHAQLLGIIQQHKSNTISTEEND